MLDTYNLQRFVDAQEGVIDGVRAELRRGRKTGHWMWFIFPQLKGLGFSSMAQYYGIASLGEAESYLEHPLLGPRLIDCIELVNLIEGSFPARDIRHARRPEVSLLDDPLCPCDIAERNLHRGTE